ncbi:MAG: hypothetical protein AB4372_21405, partial [Xenococcus sp. (in: cyanobacteria)]
MKRLITALSVLGLGIMAATPAVAQTVNKFENNGRTYVIVDGVDANSTVAFQLDSQDLTRNTRGNACGWIRISPSARYEIPNNLQISEDSGQSFGASIDTTALDTQNIRCTNGVVINGDGTNTPPTGNFKDTRGAIVIPNKVQNQQYTVKYVGTPAVTSGSANACGFRQVESTDTRDLSSFTYDDTTYSLA